MLLHVFAILVGLALLVRGADLMVTSAATIARNLGVPTMLIGLTVVGFATSAPEIIVSANAALMGATNLAIGNAVGSNIANMGLVIGVAALIQPLIVKSQTLQRELPVMVVVSLIPVILMFDLRLDRLDGLILLAAFTGFIFWVVRLGQRTAGQDAIEAEYESEIPPETPQGRAVLRILIGLTTLIIGSACLIWGSQHLARELGISELLIGATIVAVGTSLPELAVSIVGAKKGLYGLALGNVIGSNAFNALAVIGVAAVIGPADLDPDLWAVHLRVMLAFTVVFFVIAYNYTGTIRVKRWEGALLLIGFIAYHSYLALQNF
jgi:cation:H+ antiporter